MFLHEISILFDTRWLGDARVRRLCRILRSEAEAVVEIIYALRLSGFFHVEGFGGIPKTVFYRQKHCHELVASGIATIDGDLVKIAFSDMQPSWEIARAQKENERALFLAH